MTPGCSSYHETPRAMRDLCLYLGKDFNFSPYFPYNLTSDWRDRPILIIAIDLACQDFALPAMAPIAMHSQNTHHAIPRKPLQSPTTITNPPQGLISTNAKYRGNPLELVNRHNSHTIPRKPPQAPTSVANATADFESPNTKYRPNIWTETNATIIPAIPRKPLHPATNVRATDSQLKKSALRTARSEETRRRASHEVPISHTVLRQHSTRRLSKPPRVHTRKQAPGKRLQKRVRNSITQLLPPPVFLLQYERYPYNTQPGTLLGVFSSVEAVTTGAIKHGAYAFSRGGIHDGTEYLSPTGKIKIIPQNIQRTGFEAAMPRRKHSRVSHASQPNAHREPRVVENPSQAHIAIDGREGILVAVHESPTGIFCIGAFTERRRAWGACLKHKASLPFSNVLQEESRWIDEFDLPRMKARKVGTGWHRWYVIAHRIDEEIVQS